MGRQWLHAKRAVASMKKAQATGKIVREMMVAAKEHFVEQLREDARQRGATLESHTPQESIV